ncbi:hypothetical protein [Carboxylicivirga caseinilyticus]|uniref:hypothetical protein n=1 Tax=Carboxylicivirga caseinilyticus TaxID=3417572 RepID=UPI003D3580FE|nr:hypothetical protein [Marinilabiliaceae bacterium A049]
MKKIELILGIIVFIGFLMYLFLVPGSTLLILLSLGLLTIFYYVFSILLFNKIELKQNISAKTFKGISKLRIIISIASGLALSLTCGGILFRILHYPGAKKLLFLGLIATLIVLITSIIKFVRDKDNCYLMILNRLTIIGALGLILVLISELTIAKIRFRNYPEYIHIIEALSADPQNEELRTKEEIEFYRITMSEEEFESYMKYRENQNKEENTLQEELE